MKYLSSIRFLSILLCLIFSQVQCMKSHSPFIVVLNGPTCSGKTSIAKTFMKLMENKEDAHWSYLALDDIEMDESDDFEDDPDDLLHTELLRRVESEVEKGRSVLCDTVIDDKELADKKWFDLYKEKLSGYKVLFVFVYCPLKDLIKRLASRNIHAHNSGDLQNVRRNVDILFAFGRMFEKSTQDCGLGEFSRQDLQHVISSISETNVSPRDWCQIGMRYDVFDIKRDQRFFLKLKNRHDLIVHNHRGLSVPLLDEHDVNMRCIKQIVDKIYS